ncbi:hypothetical protein WKI68_27905 [Streptomyces sp. MS1.HAVA.3]|uniref:Gram-positive cocci surface proteins LPxTG domain-containing protein n=1 Tax=Streptomyces caledonius TaxID=3134107 RepID=A0ABU8U8E3_9ACTN
MRGSTTHEAQAHCHRGRRRGGRADGPDVHSRDGRRGPQPGGHDPGHGPEGRRGPGDRGDPGTPQPEAQKPESGQTPQAPQAPEAPQAPQAQPQPQPAETGKTDKHEKNEKTGKSGEQVAAAGPKMTLDGLPAGFTSGAGWSEFSLHVDNSGREAVDDYSLELVLWTLDTFGWESGDIQTEVYAPDSKGTWGWHAVEAYGSEEVYSLSLADVDVEKNEVFDLKLRMKFGKDTPPTRFSLSTTAEGGTADRVRYESKVTGPQLEEKEGPKLALQGLPAGGFTAGGAWQPFSLSVDNSGKEKIDRYGFTFIFDNAANSLQSRHLDLEVWDGERWVPSEYAAGITAGTMIDRSVGKDAKSEIKLRAKFTQDAPVGKIFLVVLADDHGVENIGSDVVFAYNSILPARTGNQPTPDGGTKPIVDGNGNGNGNGTSPTSGGRLAETGADAATSWALGGAGIALAMGAALVAGTGRRRRPTA